MSFSLICNIYYGLAFIAFLWMAWRYKSSGFLLFLLSIGFEGTLTYWIPGLSAQRMRIIYVVWISYLVYKTKAWNILHGKMRLLLWAFVVFSAFFIWDALYMNDDTFLMTFSQYSKYIVPFAAMLVFGAYFRKYPGYMMCINKFIGEFILIQIISAIVKYSLFGFQHWEGMVGTFGGIHGGGGGTSFPLVALAWVLVNSNMEIRGGKQWLFVAGLLMIGIATGKRAIVALFPAFFVLFAVFVARRRYKRGVVITIVLVPLMIYFGLRLTPSLNPEHKVWGSFDPEFAFNYAEDYSLGKENKQGNRGEGNGRVGADILILKRIMDYENYTRETWFGYGLKRIVVNDLSQYDNRNYYFGINHRGSLTGFARMFLSMGLVGLILFMGYYWFYFIHAKYWRLRLALYSLVMYDFVFYNWQTIQEPLLSIILIFVMYYSQIQYTPDGKFVGQKHPFFQ